MNATSQDVAVILPAAGSGQRFGGADNKLFATLCGRPLWLHSIRVLEAHPRVRRIVMPVSPGDRDRFESELAAETQRVPVEFVAGGDERTDSVRAGLDRILGDDAIRLVAVHDAARPLVQSRDLQAVFAAADQSGAAILAEPVSSTVKQTHDGGRSCRTLDRKSIWLAQTPQVFRPAHLSRAYEKHRGRPSTDDAELVTRIGIHVTLVPASGYNPKITYPQDLRLAEAILSLDSNPSDAPERID